MSETVKLSKLFKAISQEYEYLPEYSTMYSAMKQTFHLQSSPFIILHGYFDTKNHPKRKFEDKTIELSGPLLYWENVQTDEWVIVEYPGKYELEEKILDVMIDDEKYTNVTNLYAFFDGKIQGYTFGKILEDGTRVEVDEISENTPDIQLYWVEEISEEIFGG